jgi:MscS family membrane protein
VPVRSLSALLVATLILFFARSAAAAPTDCKTPRRAADSVFAWQQPSNFSLRMAAMCLERQGRTQSELEELARQVRAVYDKRLAFIEMDRLSDEPDWKASGGRQAVAPHEHVPGVTIERNADGDWMWTRASLERIAEYYASDHLLDDEILERIPHSLRGEVFGVALWQYIALLLAFLVGLVLRKVLQFLIESRGKSLAKRFGTAAAASVVDVFASPGATLVMAIVVHLTYPHLRLRIGAALTMAVAVRVMVVLSVVWALYRVVDVLAAWLSHKAALTDSKLDDQLVPLIRKSLKVVTVIMGALFVLQNLNVNVASLLAGLGIGGLAFALAAKDTLANFFGSIMIFSDRPFQVGDWVKIADSEGVVEEVGFRSSRIRTFYNSVVTIPNAKIVDTPVDNMGARQYRRTSTTLNLTYDTTPEQMQAFVEGVRAIIRANPHTRKDYYEVHMSAFGAHSLDVMLYFFFKVSSWTEELRERHNVFLEIMRLARALGVDFAFPTQTLKVDSVAAPAARSEPAPAPAEAELAAIVRSFGPGGERARPSGPRIVAGGFSAGSEVPAEARAGARLG